MKNELLHMTLLKGYEELAFTNEYMFGFIDRGMVYVTLTNSDLLPYVTKLDKASRGAGYSLRFKPNKMQKETLKLQEKTFVLCSKEFFESEVKASKYNKGEVFEKMVTEYYGQKWKKDSVPFTKDGDLTVNEVAYQLKFECATFCSEKSLMNLRK